MKQNACLACREGKTLSFDFTMAFQPILDLSSNMVWGYEALVRGLNGEGAAAILAKVDDENRYRFDQACRVKAIQLASALFKAPHLRLSINFMPNAVYEPAACIRASLKAAREAGFSHERLMFEFTEDERMRDVPHVANIVAEYKRFGFITAIDDFGAGYAGLDLLASLTPDIVKIDMKLLRDVHLSNARQVIIAGIACIARELGITVLAEGVESAAEVRVLRAAGIKLFQGYHFARPAVAALPQVVFETPQEQGRLSA